MPNDILGTFSELMDMTNKRMHADILMILKEFPNIPESKIMEYCEKLSFGSEHYRSEPNKRTLDQMVKKEYLQKQGNNYNITEKGYKYAIGIRGFFLTEEAYREGLGL